MSGAALGWREPAGIDDTGTYLARLLRLDPAALVRLRPAVGGWLELWARLPFEVLVTRRVPATLGEDHTVRAADLLAALDAGSGRLPAARDADWRWPVPPRTCGRSVERLPAAEVRRLGVAAGITLREATAGGIGGRAVGERALRDALLDHVPVVVITDEGARVEVPQRLVQAVVRMGFLGPEPIDGEVSVLSDRGWVALAAPYGTAWYRPSTGLDVRPADVQRVTDK